MEHYNPLFPKDENGKRFITIGEIMLRLTPPNYEKIRMTSTFGQATEEVKPTLLLLSRTSA